MNIIYKTTSGYIWHTISIMIIVALSTVGFTYDKGLLSNVISLSIFLIITFVLFYFNKRIIFYSDRIVLERFFISHAREEIMHSSIKRVNYEDALQVRFDNEKLRIVYREGRREVKKILPLNLIPDETLYEVIESFRQSGVRTIVKSKKKVFQDKDKV